MKLRWLCLVLSICVFTPSTTNNVLAASLAVSSATLSGRVTDPNGLVIAGAKVDATNVETNVTYSSETNGEGFFVISNIPPGRYRVTVEKQGFQMIVKPDVELHVQDTIALNFAMQVGSIVQSVTVESGAPLVKTETAEVSTLVSRQFVENLPLNGRSFQSLITLSPGVVLTKATTDAPGQFSVNGQRANSNYFTVDGVGANVGVSPGTNLGGSIAGTTPALGANGGTNNLVSIDALQEFKILTSSFSPEFGRTAGAQVLLVTRSGTNDFHGSAFEYFRNDVLDATDWFANANRQAKPALRQNDFGGVIGGSIIKDRTFFFFSYEGLRLRLPISRTTTVPSLSTRQAVAANVRPFINAFPLPNGRELGNGFAELNASYSDPSTLDATSIRIDQVINTKLSVFARYNYSPSSSDQRGGGGFALSTSRPTLVKTQTLTGGFLLYLGPNVNNDFRANYSRVSGDALFTLSDFGGAVAPSDSALFPASVSGRDSIFLFQFGATAWERGSFGSETQRQINFIDTVSITAGAHQMKLGVDYRRLFPILNRARFTEQAIFSNINAGIVGMASLVQINAFDGPRFPVFNNLSLFWQDAWKATKRLTLTYGLRWELDPPPTDANGVDPFTVTGLDNPPTITLAPAGTRLYKTRYNNFAPRIGGAYQLEQSQGRETVLRGGFGIFYDLGANPAATAFAVSFPFFRSKIVPATPTGVPFPLDEAAATPAAFSINPPYGSLIGILDPDFELPYTDQWNVALEQAFGRSQTVTVSYVGAVGRRLLRQEVLPRPNSNFTATATLNVARNSATSNYHALQAQFQRRLVAGLQALASYTWSHSIDNVSSDSSLEAPIIRVDPRQERGSSDFDVRHSFNGAITYDVPPLRLDPVSNSILRDWSIDTIITARTATPVNVITGANAAGGQSVSRPDLVADVPLYIVDPTVPRSQRINRAAFTVPVGRQGTLGRNVLRGFPIWQLDFALRRQFNLTERLHFQFRAEFFNIFNHPNFADPIASLSNPNFGRSTSMLNTSLGSGGRAGFNPLYQIGGPRSIQFAARLSF